MQVESSAKTADPKASGRPDLGGGKWEANVWGYACVHVRHVCACLCVCACVCVYVSQLPACIGILKSDWRGRSLLGEIVNRVEPVICSRQPWKGTPDSQGSYWEFQRCCLTDLGPSPCQTEPASRACSRIHADQCDSSFSILPSVCVSWLLPLSPPPPLPPE